MTFASAPVPTKCSKPPTPWHPSSTGFTSSFLRLNRPLYRLRRVGADLHHLPAGQILLNHTRREPVQLPSVLHRHHRVLAWVHSGKIERTVGIALVAPKQLKIVFGIFRNEHHHHAIHRLGALQRNTRNLHRPSRQHHPSVYLLLGDELQCVSA